MGVSMLNDEAFLNEWVASGHDILKNIASTLGPERPLGTDNDKLSTLKYQDTDARKNENLRKENLRKEKEKLNRAQKQQLEDKAAQLRAKLLQLGAELSLGREEVQQIIERARECEEEKQNLLTRIRTLHDESKRVYGRIPQLQQELTDSQQELKDSQQELTDSQQDEEKAAEKCKLLRGRAQDAAEKLKQLESDLVRETLLEAEQQPEESGSAKGTEPALSPDELHDGGGVGDQPPEAVSPPSDAVSMNNETNETNETTTPHQHRHTIVVKYHVPVADRDKIKSTVEQYLQSIMHHWRCDVSSIVTASCD
jgi:chromosome segregation ATPase